MKKIKMLSILCLGCMVLFSCGKKTENEETNEEFETIEMLEIDEDAFEDVDDVIEDEEFDIEAYEAGLDFDDEDVVYYEPEESAPVASASQDWDQILNDYDAYVTKFIAVSKKLSAGDSSVMGEYNSLMQSYQQLANKLSAANSEMSASQLARYNKITMRLTTELM